MDRARRRLGLARAAGHWGVDRAGDIVGVLGPDGAIDNFVLTRCCRPDCDSSTGPGVLDVFDFLCFQNRFDAGEPYACDCDTSGGPGVCDVFDFLCFQNAYAAGCP